MKKNSQNESNVIKVENSNSSKSNILDTIKLDKALRLAKHKSKDGKLEEAKNIYKDILQKFSKNKKAQRGLQLLDKDLTSEPLDPPSKKLQPIINLFMQGQLQKTLFEVIHMLERFPNSVTLYNIAGASNSGLMQFDAAIKSYKQALKIKPDYFDAYNNMGNALKKREIQMQQLTAIKKRLRLNLTMLMPIVVIVA